MNMGKKVSAGKWLVFLLLLMLLVVVVVYNFDSYQNLDLGAKEVKSLVDLFGSSVSEGFKPFLSFFGYIIGGVPQVLLDSTNEVGAVIVLVAIWLMFILMFGDIIKNFSTFSPAISWSVAVLLGIVGANLKMMSFIAAFMTAIFLPLGMFAAYVGLIGAFVVFIMVEWGSSRATEWALNKRILKDSMKGKETTNTVNNAINFFRGTGQNIQEEGHDTG